MDKLLFLSYCFFDVMIYVFVKKFANMTHESTMAIICYGNVLAVLLMMPMLIFRRKKIFEGFLPNLRLILSAPASAMKTIAIQYVSIKNATVITFLAPAAIVFLSFIMLGEYDKKNNTKYIWLAMSFIGVIVFVGFDIRQQSIAYVLLFSYVLLKGLINIFTKQLSYDRYTILFYSKFHYAWFNMVVFLISGYKFKIDFLTDPHVLLITVALVFSQLSLIQAYKLAKKISLLQNIDYSRLVFTCVFAYLIFDEKMTAQQIAGSLIIILSIAMSSNSYFIMKKYSTVAFEGIRSRYRTRRRKKAQIKTN